MIDPTAAHRIREAILNPYRPRPAGKPTVEQALVEYVRMRYGMNADPEHIVRAIAAMSNYERCRITALVWRRYQPDLTFTGNDERRVSA